MPWNQSMIEQDPAVTGWWAVNVTEPGVYEMVGRWRPAGSDVETLTPVSRQVITVGFTPPTEPISTGRLMPNDDPEFPPKLFPSYPRDMWFQNKTYVRFPEEDPPAGRSQTFKLLRPGRYRVDATTLDTEGTVRGYYYLDVQRTGDLPDPPY